MIKLLKYLIIFALGLIFLSVALVFVLAAVIDPNRYKPAIENQVARQTGWELHINGDINWTFRPVFGLSISDVSLSNGVTPQEMASFTTIALKVRPAGLLRGEVGMQEVIAENLHINWIVDEQGQSNWILPEDTAPTPEDSTAEGTASPIDINIEEITVRNASLDIQDLQQDLNASLQNLNFSSRNTNVAGRPFPLEMSMDVSGLTAGNDFTMNLSGTASMDLDAGSARMDDLLFNLSPVVLSGNVAVTNFNSDLGWEAQLSTNTFNLSYLLENFMALDEDAMPEHDAQQIALRQLDASGDTSSATLRSLELALGDAEISLNGDARFPTDGRIAANYQLTAGDIDLDAFLPASEEAPAEPQEAAQGGDIELPLDLLNNYDIQGEHNIQSLTVAGLSFAPLQFGLQLQDGVLNLETQPIGFYGGELDLAVNMDASQTPAQLAVNSQLTDINAETFTADMPQLDFFSGIFDLATNHTMSGNTVNGLLDTIDGSSEMQIRESAVDVTIIKNVFSAISVLSPTSDMGADWPDQMQFETAQASLLFNNGLRENQELNLRLDNLDVSGTGGLDLDAGNFDYRLAFTIMGEPELQTVPISENYQDVPWPIRCNAAFDDPALQYCSPDMQRVREMFTELATGEIRERATEAISERLRGLLPGSEEPATDAETTEQ